MCFPQPILLQIETCRYSKPETLGDKMDMNLKIKLLNAPSTLLSLLLTAILLISTLLTGCGGGGGDDDDSGEDSVSSNSVIIEDSIFALTAVTDNSGRGSITFAVPEGVNKLSITAEAIGSVIRFEAAESSSGVNYLDPGGEILTTAVSVFRDVSAINVPSRSSDSPLDPTSALTITVQVGSGANTQVLNPVANQTVTFIINSKADSDLNSGALPVNLFSVGPIAQSSSNGEAISRAVSLFRSIYGSQANVQIRLSEFSISGPNTLPDPISGSDFYLSAASGAPSPAVNIFIGTDVSSSFAGMASLLGLASGIPGPPNPSARSVVGISLLGSAGIDGEFSDREVQLLGETLAHETGHYLGLFHTVEISGGGDIFGFDPLGDTPTCGSLDECLSQEVLVTNLMFPSPVFTNDGSPLPQNSLSSEQRAVINRYVVVD